MTPRRDWDAQAYAQDAKFISSLGQAAVDLLNPQPGELVLDLGCGDGSLTEVIACSGAKPIGVDASIDMVRACRQRDLSAVVADGKELCFWRVFDAVFSNAALHWMKDLGRAVGAVSEVLKVNGRFVAEMGGTGNIASVVSALRTSLAAREIDFERGNPWIFPTPDELDEVLQENGFKALVISLIPRPTVLENGLRQWLEIFAASFLDLVPGAERQEMLDELCGQLEPRLRKEAGAPVLDYVRLRFAARLEKIPG